MSRRRPPNDGLFRMVNSKPHELFPHTHDENGQVLEFTEGVPMKYEPLDRDAHSLEERKIRRNLALLAAAPNGERNDADAAESLTRIRSDIHAFNNAVLASMDVWELRDNQKDAARLVQQLRADRAEAARLAERAARDRAAAERSLRDAKAAAEELASLEAITRETKEAEERLATIQAAIEAEELKKKAKEDAARAKREEAESRRRIIELAAQMRREEEAELDRKVQSAERQLNKLRLRKTALQNGEAAPPPVASKPQPQASVQLPTRSESPVYKGPDGLNWTYRPDPPYLVQRVKLGWDLAITEEDSNDYELDARGGPGTLQSSKLRLTHRSDKDLYTKLGQIQDELVAKRVRYVHWPRTVAPLLTDEFAAVADEANSDAGDVFMSWLAFVDVLIRHARRRDVAYLDRFAATLDPDDSAACVAHKLVGAVLHAPAGSVEQEEQVTNTATSILNNYLPALHDAMKKHGDDLAVEHWADLVNEEYGYAYSGFPLRPGCLPSKKATLFLPTIGWSTTFYP